MDDIWSSWPGIEKITTKEMDEYTSKTSLGIKLSYLAKKNMVDLDKERLRFYLRSLKFEVETNLRLQKDLCNYRDRQNIKSRKQKENENV